MDFDRPFVLAVEVAPLDCFALIVALLAFAECDHDFDEASLSEEFGRDDAHASFFAGGKFGDLFATDEQLSWLGIDTARTWSAAFI